MLIGKYTGLSDAYLSVIKSLQHACMEARLKLQVSRLCSSESSPFVFSFACLGLSVVCSSLK